MLCTLLQYRKNLSVVMSFAMLSAVQAFAQPSVAPSPAASTVAEVDTSVPESPKKNTRLEVAKSFKLLRKPPFSGRIAFSAKVEDRERVLVLDLATKKVSVLVDGPGNSTFPSWSPDGSKIAFVSDRDGNREIYTADWRGKNQTRITFDDMPDDNPSWHPDGEGIIFYRDQDRANSDIYLAKATEGGAAIRLTELGGRNTTPKFHPDGQRFIYSTNRFWPGWDVCEWSQRSQVEFCPLNGTESFCRAAWSSDGSLLAYTYGIGNNLNLGMVRAGTKARVDLTDLALREYDVSFIDKDQYLLFVAEAGLADRFRLHYMTVKGDTPTKPLKLMDSDYSIRYPSWSAKSALEMEANRIKAQEALKQAESQTERSVETSEANSEQDTP